jgi:hypothetical protein
VVGLNESGKTEEDRRADAMTMYSEAEKSEFKWIGIWDKLKSSPKWKAIVADTAKDARRVASVEQHHGAAAAAAAADASEPSTNERPVGNRRAKKQAAGRSAAHDAVEVMRERNIVLRDAQATMSLATHIQLFSGVFATDALSGEYQECLTYLRGKAVGNIQKEMLSARSESTTVRPTPIARGATARIAVASPATASSASGSSPTTPISVATTSPASSASGSGPATPTSPLPLLARQVRLLAAV